MLSNRVMTWEEGLRYLNAEAYENRMKDDVHANASVRYPPRPPMPSDVRMTGNSDAFMETVVPEGESQDGAPAVQPQGGQLDAVPAKQSTNPSHPTITFAQWVSASKQFNLHAMLTDVEQRDLLRRMQPMHCYFGVEIPASLVGYMVLCAALGFAAGCIVAKAGDKPPQKFRGTSFCPPSRSQKGNIEKIMSFLT